MVNRPSQTGCMSGKAMLLCHSDDLLRSLDNRVLEVAFRDILAQYPLMINEKSTISRHRVCDSRLCHLYHSGIVIVANERSTYWQNTSDQLCAPSTSGYRTCSLSHGRPSQSTCPQLQVYFKLAEPHLRGTFTLTSTHNTRYHAFGELVKALLRPS